MDLVLAIRPHTVDHGASAAPPVCLDRQLARAPGGEGVERIRAREIAAAQDDLLLLYRDGAAQDADLGARARSVRRPAAQPHGHPRGGRIVAEHGGGRVQPTYDDVQVTVAVQVRGGHSVRDARVGAEPPLPADLGEGEVAIVAEGDARHGQFGELGQFAPPLEAGERRPDPLPGVRVHDVPEMAGRDEEVLVAVQVHVQEQGVPRPVGGLDAGVGRDLREGAVAAVLEQRVPLPLRPIVDLPDQFGQGRVRGHLGLAAGPAPQHVRDEDVHVAVAVHVGKIDRHGGVAGGAERQAGRGAECPVAVVQPEQVRVLEVVAHVEVGRAVAVHVGELGGEREVLRCGGERPAGLVEKPARRPRHEREVPRAVVQVEAVRVGALLHRYQAVLGPVHDAVVLAELRDDLEVLVPQVADHLVERPLLRRVDVHRGPGLVVGDVEVEVPVPVHVGQGHRHAARVGGQPCLSGMLGEHAVPVVEKERHALAEGADEQVEVAVAVHIGEHGSRRVPPRQGDAGPGRDVLEAPVTEVLVQGVRALVARQVDVGESVSIHVADGHSAALREVAVLQCVLERDGVGEADAGPGRRELGESGAAAARHGEIAPAEPRFLVPGAGGGGMPAG